MSIEAFLDYLDESPATAQLAESLAEVLAFRGIRPVAVGIAGRPPVRVAG